jgi:uncharacterized Zn finger protein (UPF0148 family)
MINPIHKVIEGKNVTVCHKCGKVITEEFTGELTCNIHGNEKWSYYLERNDGIQHRANRMKWVSWKTNSRFNEEHNDIAIGRSLLLDFAYGNYTWMTTVVTEIILQTENEIHFKTQNSEYTLKIYK